MPSRIRKKPLFALLLLICLPGHLHAQASYAAGVQHVVDGDTLMLEDGRSVRLVGIQAPEVAREAKPGQPWGEESAAWLKREVEGRPVILAPAATPKDRYGRLLAYVWDEKGRMLQERLLAEGMAMVYSFPDNPEHIRAFHAIEARARAQGKGLWRLDAYRPLPADDAMPGIGEFRLVEGVPKAVANIKGDWYINFGENWRDDFTIYVHRSKTKHFTKAGMTPKSLRGRPLRVRGWVFFKNGPMIEASHPEQIEIVAPAASE